MHEAGEVLVVNAVMPSGESEGGELPGVYPAQDGGVAHAAPLGDKTDRDKFWHPLRYRCIRHGRLLLGWFTFYLFIIAIAFSVACNAIDV